jgi:flagellar hook-basal body complex protein FliE
MASSIIAAGAYAATQRLGHLSVSLPAQETGPAASAGGDFAAMVRQVAGGAADTARAAEGRMMQAAAGRADLVEVVTAISEGEAALETLVAVRDKVIAAYEEIMRMPI